MTSLLSTATEVYCLLLTIFMLSYCCIYSLGTACVININRVTKHPRKLRTAMESRPLFWIMNPVQIPKIIPPTVHLELLSTVMSLDKSLHSPCLCIEVMCGQWRLSRPIVHIFSLTSVSLLQGSCVATVVAYHME